MLRSSRRHPSRSAQTHSTIMQTIAELPGHREPSAMKNIVLIIAARPTGFAEKLTGQRCNDSCSWTISTKYYETAVTVNNCLLREATDDDLAETECEALVLVGQRAQKEELAAIKGWYDTKRKNRMRDASISLLVLEENPTDSNIDESSEKELHWCLSNGFELVRVSTTDDAWDGRLDREEGQGMPRVMEALAAHVWPGCTMKSRKEMNGQKEQSTAVVGESEPSFEPSQDEDAFEKLLSEMTSVSDALGTVLKVGCVDAREQLRRMPDGERRDRAASLALKLAKYFEDE